MKKAKKATSTPAKPKSTKPKTKKAPAAKFVDECRRIGIMDLRAHRVSWITGYIYVGDGTHGATDAVYFRCANSNLIVPYSGAGPAFTGGQIPVLSSDGNIGQTYMSDIEKHYSRKRVNRCSLRVVPLVPSTANSCQITVAPVRGASQSGDTACVWTSTDAPPSLVNTMGMAGAKSTASWSELELDLTSYIAGGSGPRQNEFNLSLDGASAGNAWGSGGLDLTMIAPCAFVVSGSNSTTALRGQNVALVVIEQVIDLLDFIAGNPVAAPAFTVEETRKIFALVAASADKDLRNSVLKKFSKFLE